MRHKGGLLIVWDAQGRKHETIHYGEGLQVACKVCKADKGRRCVTENGNLLGKPHKCRLS
jgi:hypothetical protein